MHLSTIRLANDPSAPTASTVRQRHNGEVGSDLTLLILACGNWHVGKLDATHPEAPSRGSALH